MGIIFDQPKYPVVDRAPGLKKTVGNFGFSDLGTWGAVTVLSLPAGYVAGMKTPLMARPSMYIAGGLGALAGFLLAYQNSAGRLMGFKPNDAEVNKYLQRS